MDLGTIKLQLITKSISNVDQFVQKVNLVFNNARIFNPPLNPVTKYYDFFYQDEISSKFKFILMNN